MTKLKLYKTSETLNKGSMVRLDSPLFIAVMNEAINQGIPSWSLEPKGAKSELGASIDIR